MSRQQDLQKQIAEHQRHLQILKQQAAGFGPLNAPTHLVTQIQDREAAIEKLQTELAELKRQEVETGTYTQNDSGFRGLSVRSLEIGSSGCIMRGLYFVL